MTAGATPKAGEKTSKLVHDLTEIALARAAQALDDAAAYQVFGEDLVEIVRGLAEGEQVIVGEAARTIAPGMAVRPTGAAEGSVS